MRMSSVQILHSEYLNKGVQQLRKEEKRNWNREVKLLRSYFTRDHFSNSDPLTGAEHMDDYYTITAAAAPPDNWSSCLAERYVWHWLPPQKNSFHSFQTRMPIFRVLLSAVMAVGSLASFNPSLPQTSWLAEGMPLRSNPSSNSDYTAPPSPLKCWEGLWGGMSSRNEKVEPLDRSCCWEPRGHSFRWRTKHKMMIMMTCGYFGVWTLVWMEISRTLFSLILILFGMFVTPFLWHHY